MTARLLEYSPFDLNQYKTVVLYSLIVDFLSNNVRGVPSEK